MHCGKEENYNEKLNRIASFIVDNDIDVILLQEVSQSIVSPLLKMKSNVIIKEDNLVDILCTKTNSLSSTPYDYYYDVSHIGFDTLEEGLAILTKHTIDSLDSRYVSSTTDLSDWKARKIVRATIDDGKQRINFYSCHFGWWEDNEHPAKCQFDLFDQWLNKEEVSIIGGDFNNNAGEEGYQYLTRSLNYVDLVYKSNPDLFLVPTIYEGDRIKPIDYIFSTSEIDVVDAKHVFTKKDGMVSDHVALYIEIK